MFMRISRGRVKPGMWPEYERRYREVVQSGIGHSPGLRARWLLRDLDDADAGYSVSLWESAASMEEYSRDPQVRTRMHATFGDLFTGQFETQLCDVRAGMELEP